VAIGLLGRLRLLVRFLRRFKTDPAHLRAKPGFDLKAGRARSGPTRCLLKNSVQLPLT